MPFTCLKDAARPHQHDTVAEARSCWGSITLSATVATAPAEELATPRQTNYIKDLGGTVHPGLTKTEASGYIKDLLAYKRRGRTGYAPVAPHTPAAPTAPYVPPRPVVIAPSAPAALLSPRPARYLINDDPRVKLIAGLIDLVPTGYYAVRADETDPYVFLRYSQPKKGQYAGSHKFQSQHGPRWDHEATLWPSGRWTLDGKKEFISSLLLLCSNTIDASIAYGRELRHCCRCNLELTDDRSRHYSMGPDCEQIDPERFAQIEERVGVYRG